MVMIEIKEDKFDGLYENVEKGLRYFDKAMNCLSEMKRDSRGRYVERSRMPDYRGRGGRGGMREYDDYDEEMRDGRERREKRDYQDWEE